MNQRADASGVGACNHCRAAAMPIAAPKWRLWTKLYWMRLCSMRRQQAGRLKFAIRSRKGGTWRGFAPEQVLPSRTARHASRINSQDDCWVCPHLSSMAMRAYSGGFSHPQSILPCQIHRVRYSGHGNKAIAFCAFEVAQIVPGTPGSVWLRLIRFAHLGQRGRSIGRSDGWGRV